MVNGPNDFTSADDHAHGEIENNMLQSFHVEDFHLVFHLLARMSLIVTLHYFLSVYCVPLAACPVCH